jgi:homoserine kinase type II
MQYDIGTLTDLIGISDGIENTNYILKTTVGSYILTLFEQVSAGDLPFYLSLMEYLSQQGISCPTPISDNKGQIQHHLLDRPAAIFSYLDGTSLQNHDITAKDCAILGKILAKLHLSAKEFSKEKENPFSLAGWHIFFDRCQAEIQNFDADLSLFLKQELSFLDQHWPTNITHDLPWGLIHADLFPDNILFDEMGCANIIDFYLSCTDYWAYDLAICLNAWCFDDKTWDYNYNRAKALITAYQEIRPMSKDEQRIFPILLRGAALRFLLNRLLDQANTPKDALITPKDPKEYIEKLKFHQNNKAEYF